MTQGADNACSCASMLAQRNCISWVNMFEALTASAVHLLSAVPALIGGRVDFLPVERPRNASTRAGVYFPSCSGACAWRTSKSNYIVTHAVVKRSHSHEDITYFHGRMDPNLEFDTRNVRHLQTANLGDTIGKCNFSACRAALLPYIAHKYV